MPTTATPTRTYITRTSKPFTVTLPTGQRRLITVEPKTSPIQSAAWPRRRPQGNVQVISIDPAPGNGPAKFGVAQAMWDGTWLTVLSVESVAEVASFVESLVNHWAAQHHGQTVIVVEDTVTAPLMFRHVADTAEVVRVKPTRSKAERLLRCAAADKVALSSDHEWSDLCLVCAGDLQTTMRAHGDALDALSQAINWAFSRDLEDLDVVVAPAIFAVGDGRVYCYRKRWHVVRPLNGEFVTVGSYPTRDGALTAASRR